jgi:DUF971 family protein
MEIVTSAREALSSSYATTTEKELAQELIEMYSPTRTAQAQVKQRTETIVVNDAIRLSKLIDKV